MLSKQQWPDHELLADDGDHKRDRDRKVLAYVQAEADEWEPEAYQNESAKDSAWDVSESRDAWEQASVDEAGTWEVEDDSFEGSFADEDEERSFHPGRNPIERSPCLREKPQEEQLHKREQSCMISRVVVVATIFNVQTGKDQRQ